MIITALTVLDNGLDRLLHGYDSHGNVCNSPNAANASLATHRDTTGLPFVLFFNYTDPLRTRKVCVRACPSANLLTQADFKNYTLAHNHTLCDSGVPPGAYTPAKCPPLPVLKAYPLASRCLPDLEQLVLDGFTDYGRYLKGHIEQSKEIAKLSIVQVYENAPKLAALALASLLITVLLAFLLRYIAKTVIYSVMVIAAAGSVSIAVYLWVRFSELVKSGSDASTTGYLY